MTMTPLDFDPGRFRAAPMRRIAAYWQSKCAPGRLPGRADILPEELRGDLPHVYLIDVLRQPLRFRFRLVGTAVCVLAGRDYTGAFLTEAKYGPNWQAIFDAYREVVERREPLAAELFAPWFGRDFHYYERFLAPLCQDGGPVTMIFAALHSVEEPETA